MKKTLTIIIFGISSILFAESDLASVESLLQKARPADLPTIAVNYSALGSTFQIKKDYKNALLNYKKSLDIRKAIGLDRTHGYANILFLHSIVEHKMGNSCNAVENVKKAIHVYNYLGLIDEAVTAEKEGLGEFKQSCKTLVSQN